MARHSQRSQEPVNFIHQFLLAIDKIQETDDMNPTHVSLYFGLFTMWNLNHFNNPISINRDQVMEVSKIGSKRTYLKCIRDLEKMGFIEYKPSKNPVRGSLVNMCSLGTSSDPSTAHVNQDKRGKSDPSSGSSSEPSCGQVVGHVLHPSLNSINYINNKDIYNEKEFSINRKKGTGQESIDRGTETSVAHSGQELPSKNPHFTPPSKKEVLSYFALQSEAKKIIAEQAAEEAEKFINYYAAKGWRVGAKAPMKDWQAAARNWLMNYNKFNSQSKEKHQAGQLHNNENKNYDMKL
jgi:hypothetical protein